MVVTTSHIAASPNAIAINHKMNPGHASSSRVNRIALSIVLSPKLSVSRYICALNFSVRLLTTSTSNNRQLHAAADNTGWKNPG